MEYLNLRRVIATLPPPDPRLVRRATILQTLRAANLNEAEALELHNELGEIATSLRSNPAEEGADHE